MDKGGPHLGPAQLAPARPAGGDRAGELPTFEKLTATTDRQFYREDSGTNYAQARYLLLFLQERGLLRRFYEEFAAGHRADPTGYRTLTRVLGNPDMARFQKEWSAWVLGLRFPST